MAQAWMCGDTAVEAVETYGYIHVVVPPAISHPESRKAAHMNKSRLQRSTLMLSALLALTACGGGGSSNSDPAPNPPATGEPPPPTQPPVQPPVQPPAPVPPTTQELVQKYYDDVQKITATSLPTKGSDRYGFFDACAFQNGRSKADQIANWDANQAQLQVTNAYTVGRTFSNIQILAERKTTNADGSARHEVDVTVDTKYTDGTAIIAGAETLIAGSSSGTCAVAETGPEMRYLGNQQKVALDLISRNRVETYRQLADGSVPAGRPPRLRREVAFVVSDPAKVATYAVASWGAAATPYSIKLLSPRIARDAPEMQDAAGSGTYTDTSNFRQCKTSAANTELDAAKGDCTSATLGIQNETWGWNITNFDDANRAAGDANFDKLGLGTGAEVTFAIYADDGWKTVNGQAGKTPIATYKLKIKNASYPFSQLNLDAYPQFLTVDPNTPIIADQFRTTGGTVKATVQAATPPAGGLPMVPNSLYSFHQGPKTTSASGRYQVRETKSAAFPSGASSLTIPFDGKPASASAVTYGEFSMSYSDRNGREMLYSLQFGKF